MAFSNGEDVGNGFRPDECSLDSITQCTMQDPNSVSLASLLKTLAKLRRVTSNDMRWSTYIESLC